MSDRFPLILNTSTNQIQEIASGDTLDLTGNNIKGVGIITATSFVGDITGGVTGNVIGNATGLTGIPDINVRNITGVGATFSGSLIFNGNVTANADIDVDGHTNLDNVSIAGVVTATTFVGAVTGNVTGNATGLSGNPSINITDLDVDGHTNLDNVSIAGVVTSTGNLTVQNDYPTINLTDTNNNDFRIQNRNGVFSIADVANGDIVKFAIDSSNGINSMAGTLAVGALNVVNDLDVDGHTNLDNVSIVGLATVSRSSGGGAEPIFKVLHSNLSQGILFGYNTIAATGTNTNVDLRLESKGSGLVYIIDGLQAQAGINVTGNATVSGNLSVGGVLTYEDVTNIDSVGIVTARTGLKVLAGGANVVGVVTATAGMFVPDNQVIHVGNVAGTGDLQIYHDTSHSYVKDVGTGDLILQTQGGAVSIKYGSDMMIYCQPSNKVELNYANSPKLATTNTGISVTGNILQTGSLNLNDDQRLNIGNSGDLRMHHDQANTINYINSQNGNLRIQQGGTTLIQTVGTAAKLYFSGGEKLATTNTGVTVTGTVAATSFTGDGSNLTGISVGITTEQVTPSSNVATLNLAKDDHKIVASGTYTIDVSGGTEAGAHTLRIENSGTANVGFSTYFKFPSGGTPSLPTASGAISLISFSVHKVGSVGIATVLLSGASVNYS